MSPKLILKPSVFTDAFPGKMLGRKEERKRVEHEISNFLSSGSGRGVIVEGEFGIGKSTLLNSIFPSDAPFNLLFECYRDPSPSVLLALAVQRVYPMASLDGLSRNELLASLRRALASKGGKMVIFLDDAHVLSDFSVVSQLEQIEEVFLVISCPPIFSSYFPELPSLHLDPLPPKVIFEILLERAERGLRTGSWNEEMLRIVAEESGGNPRRAIEVLLRAAQLAELSGRDEIFPEDVRRALSEVSIPPSPEKILLAEEEEKRLMWAVFLLLKERIAFTSSEVAELIGVSRETARKKLLKLVAEGILSCLREGRTVKFFAPYPVELFTSGLLSKN